ncbi:capsule biosynthesis protein [Labrys okinawensis]|uniref:capsule biosynthesis protein n=1 Tax=Labrys okinawensis TaxID=346911 RepID=UPI0039BC6FA6
MAFDDMRTKDEEMSSSADVRETWPSRGVGLALRKFTKDLTLRKTQVPVEVPSKKASPVSTIEPSVRRSHPYLWTFILFVCLPSISGAVYFIHFAANQYQSEARLSVRAMEQEALGKGDDAEAGTSSARSAYAATSPIQNAYILTSYIRSRAIIDSIAADLDVVKIFQRPEADALTALRPNASIDEVTTYWQRMVDAYVDPSSGIVILDVTTFRPDDSLKLSQAILRQSEKLLNRISEQARNDATRSATEEVRQTFVNLQASLKALQDFRNKDAIIDPSVSSARILNLLTPLMAESLKARNDEAMMASTMAADAPSLKALRTRIAALDGQITTLKGQLTGSDSQTVAASITKFEELDIARLINEKNYSRAQAALDRAEIRARRQAVYLSVFVPPSAPQSAQFPYRFGYSFMLFTALLILWGIGAAIYASIEDHRL